MECKTVRSLSMHLKTEYIPISTYRYSIENCCSSSFALLYGERDSIFPCKDQMIHGDNKPKLSPCCTVLGEIYGNTLSIDWDRNDTKEWFFILMKTINYVVTFSLFISTDDEPTDDLNFGSSGNICLTHWELQPNWLKRGLCKFVVESHTLLEMVIM